MDVKLLDLANRYAHNGHTVVRIEQGGFTCIYACKAGHCVLLGRVQRMDADYLYHALREV